MKKLPLKYENPFDNMIYVFVEEISPYLYRAKLTPNMITTFGNVLSIIGLLNLWHRKYKEASIYFGVAYVMDCVDGYLARKYNMVSKFGDYYDHVSDISKFMLFLISLVLINPKTFLKVLPIIVFFFIGFNLQLYYQEYYYNKKEASPTLAMISAFVPRFLKPNNKKQSKQFMRVSRFFGSGTFNLVLVLIIMFYDNIH